MRTDALSASAVVERVLATLDDAVAIRSRTWAAVDELRGRLDDQYRVLRAELGLSTS
jgi:hypothetical protein